MSELPKGWAWATLGEIAEMNARHTQAELGDDTIVSFLPMPAVQAETGNINLEQTRPWAQVKRGYSNFRDGDVLFAKITPCMENGKVAVCSGLTNGVGAGSTEFHVLRPSALLDPKYLFFYLLQRSVRSDARLAMKGAAGQLRVPAVFLERLCIPLPPLPEQRRIVAEIEKQFTRLDDAQRTLSKTTLHLRALEIGLLHQAFEESPDVRWRQLGTLIVEGPQNGLYKPAGAYGNGLPIVRIDDIRAGSTRRRGDLKRLSISTDEQATYGLEPNDVLINRVNSMAHLGKSAIITPDLCPAVFESNMMRLRTAPELSPRWLSLYLNSPSGRRRLTANAKQAVNQASINQKDVKSTLVPLLSRDAQTQTLERIDDTMSLITAMAGAVEPAMRHASRLRQAILAKAFSGQFVAQDPNDEPASVLLERIRRNYNGNKGKTKKRLMFA